MNNIWTNVLGPAIKMAEWVLQAQIFSDLSATNGRGAVQRKLWRHADRELNLQKNLLIAVVEARGNRHTSASGMRQALGYADWLGGPFAFSPNGEEKNAF